MLTKLVTEFHECDARVLEIFFVCILKKNHRKKGQCIHKKMPEVGHFIGVYVFHTKQLHVIGASF